MPRKKRVACVCAWCSVSFEKYPSLVRGQKKHFCTEQCRKAEEASRTVTFACSLCGKQRTAPRSNIKTTGPLFCSRECSNRYHTADRHAKWVGGVRVYRGANWKEQRAKALKRDKNTCQACGVKDRVLAVHHKTPYRISHDNSLKNLITLCDSCHMKADEAWRKAHPFNQLRLL